MNKPLLLIEFHDSTHDPNWKDDNIDFGECSVCKVVGWKVQSTRKCIVLAMMLSDGGRCSERMIIPKGAIMRQSLLKEVE